MIYLALLGLMSELSEKSGKYCQPSSSVANSSGPMQGTNPQYSSWLLLSSCCRSSLSEPSVQQVSSSRNDQPRRALLMFEDFFPITRPPLTLLQPSKSPLSKANAASGRNFQLSEPSAVEKGPRSVGSSPALLKPRPTHKRSFSYISIGRSRRNNSTSLAEFIMVIDVDGHH